MKPKFTLVGRKMRIAYTPEGSAPEPVWWDEALNAALKAFLEVRDREAGRTTSERGAG